MSTATSASAEQLFWQWFAENNHLFRGHELPAESAVDALTEKLQAYNDGLVWEMSVPDAGIQELIISADGDPELFEAVEKLCTAHPAIPGWNVTAFRPAIGLEYDIVVEGLTLSPEDIWIRPIASEEGLDIVFHLPDFEEEKRELYQSGCFILMDMALGEYDAATKVRYVDHQPLPDDFDPEELVPLRHLDEVVEWYFTEVVPGSREQ